MTEFTPQVQQGLFLTTEETAFGTQFVLAAALRNSADQPVDFTTSSSSIFSPQLNQWVESRREYQCLWKPNVLSAQAVTTHTLYPNKTYVESWTVLNAKEAYEEAVSLAMDSPVDIPPAERVREKSPVSPQRLGTISVECTFPSPRQYSGTLTRRFDLQNSLAELDDSLPDSDENALESRP